MCLVGRNRPQQQSGRYAAASGRRRRDIQNSSSRAPKAATATTKIAVQNGGYFAPCPVPSATVRDVKRGTACRLEPLS